MGISSIYIMDHKGRVLIHRAYRADVPYGCYEVFQRRVLEFDELNHSPIIYDEELKIAFLHQRY